MDSGYTLKWNQQVVGCGLSQNVTSAHQKWLIDYGNILLG